MEVVLCVCLGEMKKFLVVGSEMGGIWVGIREGYDWLGNRIRCNATVIVG